MSFLSVTGISKSTGDLKVLDDISFKQIKGKKLAIAGETGSGKSTLLKVIAGLAQPDKGVVVFRNERVQGPDERLVPGHPGISYLSQNFELPGSLTVSQVLRYANKLGDGEAEKIYRLCRIDHLTDHKTNALSGGEKQRIALARTLTSLPDLLLLDEPYSNLDSFHKNTLKSVIDDIVDELDITCILVSHDPVDTLSWADDVIILRNGEIIQTGSPQKIYHEPANEYVAGMFGKYNVIHGALAKLFFPNDGINHLPIRFVRPEQFKFVPVGHGVVGKVKKVVWCGSYVELEVIVSKKRITISMLETTVKRGDEVSIAVYGN
jgi:ABC-type sulfate/molybdate transport systems ATPase subunit